MTVTEAQIDELLKILEALLKQIEPLRTRVGQIEKELAQAQREYQQKLSEANDEADRLKAARDSLDALLNRKPPPPSKTGPPAAEVTPPAEILEINPDGGMSPLPPPQRESLRTRRKRALLDYIFNFTDSGPVIEQINAIVDDEQRELGDMLELLVWGEIWKARTNWETLNDQWHRLTEWRSALEQRVTYWKDENKRLEEDRRYTLWERRSELGEKAWQAWLDDLLRKQQVENQRAATEVARLEERWQAQKTISPEVPNG